MPSKALAKQLIFHCQKDRPSWDHGLTCISGIVAAPTQLTYKNKYNATYGLKETRRKLSYIIQRKNVKERQKIKWILNFSNSIIIWQDIPLEEMLFYILYGARESILQTSFAEERCILQIQKAITVKT